jgi:hypothetical protein
MKNLLAITSTALSLILTCTAEDGRSLPKVKHMIDTHIHIYVRQTLNLTPMGSLPKNAKHPLSFRQDRRHLAYL